MEKNMSIREYADQIGFEVVGKLKFIQIEPDGARLYYDDAQNEYYKSKTGICIITADGGVI